MFMMKTFNPIHWFSATNDISINIIVIIVSKMLNGDYCESYCHMALMNRKGKEKCRNFYYIVIMIDILKHYLRYLYWCVEIWVWKLGFMDLWAHISNFGINFKATKNIFKHFL